MLLRWAFSFALKFGLTVFTIVNHLALLPRVRISILYDFVLAPLEHSFSSSIGATAMRRERRIMLRRSAVPGNYIANLILNWITEQLIADRKLRYFDLFSSFVSILLYRLFLSLLCKCTPKLTTIFLHSAIFVF